MNTGPFPTNPSKDTPIVDLPPVDLKELQTQNPNVGPRGILQIIEAGISGEALDTQLRVFYPAISHTKTRERRRYVTRQRLAAKMLFEAVDDGIAEAETIEEFAWRSSLLLDPETDGVQYYRSHKAEYKNYFSLVGSEKSVRSLQGLVKFAERHPELQDEAVTIWAKGFNARYADGGGVPASIFSVVTNLASERLFKERQSRTDGKIQETNVRYIYSLFRQISKQIDWLKEPAFKKMESNDIRLLLLDLELIPVAEQDDSNLQALYSQLANREKGSQIDNEFMVRSLNALRNFTDSLAALDPKINDGPVGKINQKFKATTDSPEGLGYRDIISVAMAVTPVLKHEIQLDVSRLRPDSVEDYSKAVDRLLVFFMQNSAPILEKQDAETIARFNQSAECIKLLALNGVADKLKQVPITLGDLVLSLASNLSALEKREIIESVQTTRKQSKAQITYAELRGIRKSYAWFNRYRAGSGLMK